MGFMTAQAAGLIDFFLDPITKYLHNRVEER